MPPQPIVFASPADPAVGLKTKSSGFVSFSVAPPREPTPPPAPVLTFNQRRKSAVVVPSTATERLSSKMRPLNVTIVARCLVRPKVPSPPPTNKKRSSHQTPAASPTPSIPATGPAVHPYNRLHDLANTRSTIPSPQELLRAERAEEEKARQKKENAAAARAAAALARRRKALRSSRGTRGSSTVATPTPTPMIPPIQRAVAAQRARSAEAAAAEAHAAEAAQYKLPTTEPEDGGEIPTPRTLKRTRSSGLGPVSVGGNGAVNVNSPLRAVTSADDDKDKTEVDGALDETSAPRKRSRLAESVPPTRASRRGSTSPAGSASSLPEASPRKSGESSPKDSEDSTSMRRVQSESQTQPMVRERSRRETQVPARMRDYDR